MAKTNEQTTAVALTDDFKNVAKQLNSNVLAVISQENLIGFEKAYLISTAASEIEKALNDTYMKPIMALQGNRLGFKTDKDDKGGYDMKIVKNCLIEAVLMGVQPFGNQFNIIAGGCYVTKEGFGYLLSKLSGLKYEIIPSLPRINGPSAAVVMKIKWTHNNASKEVDMDIPVKVNAYMGTDAVLGKATRKARKWLYETITGTEVSDGDAIEVNAEIVSSKIEKVDTKSDAVAASVKSMMPKKTEAPENPAPKGDDPSRLTDDEKSEYKGQGKLI
jgi:hypothetical protein